MRLSSPRISPKAIPTASLEIRREGFFVCESNASGDTKTRLARSLIREENRARRNRKWMQNLQRNW